MKTPLITTFFIAGAVSMMIYCGCADNHRYARYQNKNPAFGIEFDYISGWDIAEHKGSRGSFVQASFYEPSATKKRLRATMVATVEPAAKVKVVPPTIEAYAQDVINRRMSFKDARVISKKNIKCSGQPAVELVLQYMVADNPESLNAVSVLAKEHMVIFKKEGSFYIFRYLHDADEFNVFSNAFQRLLASVSFNG